MENRYCVYWICDHSNQDPFEHGYVGITANFEYRIKRYRQPGQKSHLYHKLKCGAEVKVIAKELSQFEALILERKLRPHRNIGWNKNSGGFMPPIPTCKE